jgi:HEAT repeat protein
MGLFGPPNIERMKNKRDVDGLIKALTYPEDGEVRRNAALALGTLKDHRALDPLIVALKKDWDLPLNLAAAEALGMIGDERAVMPLISKLCNASICGLAEDALAQIGAPAVGPLIAFTKENQRSSWAVEALAALKKISDPRAFEQLLVAGSHPNSHVRAAAMQALGGIGDPRAMELLIEGLADVPIAAAKAIAMIGPRLEASPLQERAHAALNSILKGNQDFHLRWLAAHALEKSGWQPVTDDDKAWYWTLLENWDQCVTLKEAAVIPCMTALRSDSVSTYEGAGKTLARIGDPAVGPLIEILQDLTIQTWTRRTAVEALGQIGPSQAIGLLVGLLQSNDFEIRLSVAEALVKLYYSGKLNSQFKEMLHANQEIITKRVHLDVGGGRCDNDWERIDRTYPGVNFL